jgi:hypothetical protein
MADTINTLITGIESSKEDIATSIEGKGVTVPSGTKLADMSSLIDQISIMHGPASSVDGNLAAFDGTSGDTLKDSGIAASAIALDTNVVHKGTSSTASNEDIYGTKTFKSGGVAFASSGAGSDPVLQSGIIGAGGKAVELTGTGLVVSNIKMSGGFYTPNNGNAKVLLPDTTN